MDRYYKIKSKNQKRLLLNLFALLGSVLTLTVTSMAWFVSNRQSNIVNDAIAVRDNFSHQYHFWVDGVSTDNKVFDFSSFYPGNVHKRNLSFTLKNQSEFTFLADLYFNPVTTGQEIPFVDGSAKWGAANTYYYLGSQIQITDVTVTIDSVEVITTTAEGSYLVTTNSVGVTKGQVNGVSSPVTNIPILYFIRNVSLASGKTLVGSIDFTFVDNKTDQSMYMVDWPLVGACSRGLSSYLHVN